MAARAAVSERPASVKGGEGMPPSSGVFKRSRPPSKRGGSNFGPDSQPEKTKIAMNPNKIGTFKHLVSVLKNY